MCGGGTWKREVVPDHKFDFVDTRDFTDHSCGMRMKYLWLYITILISFLVYLSDIFTAVTMLTSKTWSNEIYDSCPSSGSSNGCVYIPFDIGKWLFFGCIVASFLLLAYEARKTKKIIASRDISYAFTNVMANNYYSLRSYDHFCFFQHISSSTSRTDDFAFFVFFTFKGWKRLIFAEGPRQSINALTLYAFYLAREDDGKWYDVSKYFSGTWITTALTISIAFTTLIFALQLLMLIIAGICYLPLLCYIQGNLKEYCCYKVDKRIAEIIKRRNKQRLAKAAALAKKEAAGDFSHLKNKKGEIVGKPLPQPTLPNISVDDDNDKTSMHTRAAAPSTFGGDQSEYSFDAKSTAQFNPDFNPADYPPMPAYNQPYSQHQYNPSVGTFEGEHASGPYEEEYGSTAHLTSSAAPFARTDPGRVGMHNPYSLYGEGASPIEPDYPHQRTSDYADPMGYNRTSGYGAALGYPQQQPARLSGYEMAPEYHQGGHYAGGYNYGAGQAHAM